MRPLVPFLRVGDDGVGSARFATVRFMFQHKGRVRVALDKQSAEDGGVDRLFEESLAAGAEDFDQIPGSGEDVEVEVRGLPISCMYMSEQSGWPTIDSVRSECAGEDNGCGHPVRSFTGAVVQ